MKRTLFCFYFLLTLFLAQSQTKLNVLLNDGTKHEFDLFTSKLTFTDNDSLIVWNNNIISSILSLNSVSKVFFGNLPDGVVPVKNDNLKMYYSDGTVFINGIQSNQNVPVTLFDITGSQVMSLNMSHNGTINVSYLNHGIYFVLISNHVMKFIK
ncbi:MAG: T9SS type A sorting domain-containing protein [Paludibacter sp.]